MTVRPWIPAMLVSLASITPSAATAQSRQQQEFVQQGLLIPAFASNDRRLGRSVADELRGAVQKLHNRRELTVISGSKISETLLLAGFDDRRSPDSLTIRALARNLRADEIIRGTADRTPDGVRVNARLILARDEKQLQPLPVVTARTVEAAVAQLAPAIREARRQLVSHRRCENALRDINTERAIQMAKDGIQVYPRSTIARVCLLKAYLYIGTVAEVVLGEALAVLEQIPDSYWALDAAAKAYDAARDRERAAEMWLRLAASDTANIELTMRVVNAMAENGNSLKAEPLIVRASDARPEHLDLLRLRWRLHVANKSWKATVAVGERLLAMDSVSRADSTFFLRLATAYQANNQPLRAVEIAARGTADFPKDDRLYLVYTQLVRAESQIVVERGLALFPTLAELHVLQAQELKEKGKAEEAIVASRRALELDSTLTHGFLQLAQAEFELGRVDSALVSMRRALANGEDTTLVRQFALARGNSLFRAASGTKIRPDFELAMRFLGFADSLGSTPQSKFLLGTTALSITQSAATDAPKEKSCDLARQATSLIPLAQQNLVGGAEIAPDAARQYLEYLEQLTPVVAKQVEVLCVSTPP
jgi:tetratricopeptide (TPR) repeat protein